MSLSYVSVRWVQDRWIVAAANAVTLLIVTVAMLVDSGGVEGLLIFWAFAFFVPTLTLLALAALRDRQSISHVLELTDLQRVRIANLSLVVVVVWFHSTLLQENENARVWLVEMSSISSAVLFIYAMKDVPWRELKDLPWQKEVG